MIWIGLTGGLGTGKSTVAQMLRESNFSVIDADQISRDVVAVGGLGLGQVVAAFGKDVLNQDQSLNRKKIAELIFQDTKKKELLENIVHPLVQQEVVRLRDQLQKQGKQLAFYDVPLLFEKKIPGFDAVIVVAADSDFQKQRLIQRNNWSDAEIDSRQRNQLPLVDKIKSADYVLINNGSLVELRQQLVKIIDQIKVDFNLKQIP